MSLEYVKGDLVSLIKSGEFDVFLHGCNCFNTMGAGVAKEIRDNFPLAYQADQATVKGDKGKLGGYSSAIEPLGDHRSITLVNWYTQYRYGKDKQYLNYNALVLLSRKLAKQHTGKRVLMVKIGGGLAGGDWPLVAKMVEHIMSDLYSLCVIDY